MPRPLLEIAGHDALVQMMAQHFKSLGYADIKADIAGWVRPDSIYWVNKPSEKFIPDLTCFNANGKFIILEAETCSTFSDAHTHAQFEIFRAHATKLGGEFHVVVPRQCGTASGRDAINAVARTWAIAMDNVWTPSA